MLKFSDLLYKNFHPKFKIDEIYPKPLISLFLKKGNLRKWASYTDKYLIFRNRIKHQLLKNYDLFHITDQSNTVYAKEIQKKSDAPILVTCHDLIAIRQAKDEFKVAPKISKTGKLLQSWIHSSLTKANYFACDSNSTLIDLNRLVPNSLQKAEVIHLGTDFTDAKNNKNYFKKFSEFDPKNENFIMHVGSAAWYKNRNAVFKAFKLVKKRFKDLKLVLVGPKPQIIELDDFNITWLKENINEIIILEKISEVQLRNLYSHAKALLFPSFIEGFGWPPLEAAFCGCKVITSKTGAIFDLLGDSATYIQPNDQRSINEAIIDVFSTKEREKHKVDLPSQEDCRVNYYNLYSKLIKN
jgi:glycosyltransferase involved in cell wall biosynthesis